MTVGGPRTQAATSGTGTSATEAALVVQDLTVEYRRRGAPKKALHEVSLSVRPGESYGLVGESGCGKTTLGLAIMRYLPANAAASGAVLFGGEDLLALPEPVFRRYRGRRLAMVSQDPAAALNPTMRIGAQVIEAHRSGQPRRSEVAERARESLRRVGLADAEPIMARYPYELSGGQQQRVLIAMALAGEPSVLVLDEPTTGLDATVEAEVMDLLTSLRRQFDMATVFISHNLRLVAQVCDRIGVLYAGRLVEEGGTRDILDRPRHAYTESLLRCLPGPGTTKHRRPVSPIPGGVPTTAGHESGCSFAPRCGLATDECRLGDLLWYPIGPGHRSRCHHHGRVAELPVTAYESPARAAADSVPLLEVTRASKHYGETLACDDVSISIGIGEVLGLVGESGSGKSTLAGMISGLVPPDAGTVTFNGVQLASTPERRKASELRDIQVVFQSPDSTLNPRHSIRQVLGRAIRKLAGKRTSAELAAEVQLAPDLLDQRPAQLSGGQRQRTAIGRAIAGAPRLILCDEPLSALDVSVQAGILNLLSRLQAIDGVAFLFISHDLEVVRYVADRIAVMYGGRIVETGPADDIFTGPRHPYTDILISSMPSQWANRARIPVTEKPSRGISAGCPFARRCPEAIAGLCEIKRPPVHDAGNGHAIHCHLDLADLPVPGRSASALPATASRTDSPTC